MHDVFSLRGHVMIELLDDQGERQEYHFKNGVRDALREAVASAIAQQSTSFPTQIQIADGCGYIRQQIASSTQDATLSLNSTTQQKIAQYVAVSDGGSHAYYRGVLLWLKRIGTPAGTLSIELRTQSGGMPSGAGAAVTGGVSQSVSAISLSTSFGWVPFWFGPASLPVRSSFVNIILSSSGYTYSAGVTEVVLGTDASSPDGTTGLASIYNGSSWSAVSPNTAGIFRMIAAATSDLTSVPGITTSVTKTISGRSKQNKIAARLLASFAKSEANDYIASAGLLTDSGVLCAIANMGFQKLNTQILNVYWIIEVE